ncbi:MAG: sugar ABC transporter permease [Treponema sp.]|nr:sugar ABC transporter permease [Treponema sp.]
MQVNVSRRGLWKEIRRNRVAYAYIAPFYLLFAIFGLFPIVMGLGLSFFKWYGTGPFVFSGLKNYADLFNTVLFWKSLSNTAIMGIIGNFFNLAGGLVLAYILNSKLVKYPNLFKTIYFLPMVTSAVAAAIIFQFLFSLNSGIFNYILQIMGFERVHWLGGTGKHIKTAVIIMFSWKWIGWNMVIYLAGMQGISYDIIESAIVDGASHARIFLRITLPILRPIILFTIIQSTIGSINLFTEPFMLTGGRIMIGGPANQGLTAMMFLLGKAPYGNNLYGYASACAIVLCIIIIIVSIFFMNVMGEREGAVVGNRHRRAAP